MEIVVEEEGKSPDSDVDDHPIEEEETDLNYVAADLNNKFDFEEEGDIDPTIDKITSYK